jgi:signal transduction histidine kinase
MMSFFNYFRQQNLRIRLIIAFILTVLIPLIGTSLYGNWITSRVLQSRAVEVAQADLHLRRLQIEETLQGVEEDLLFLSQMNSMTALLNGRSPENIARAQIDLADFVSTHPDVFQARYLDETGMEVVRIDATSDGLTLVPPDQLQNKANRYYFTQTMALPPGVVYISAIDLNREFGKIQEPHTPTLRYATPVFTADSVRVGIVILNLYAAPLLQYAQVDTLSLTDEAGYFLAHPNVGFTWGSPADLNTGINSQTIYPGAWNDIRQSDQGIILPEPENRLQIAWEFLNPFVALDDGRRVLVFEMVQGGNNRWWLINDLPRATLLASVGDFRVTAVLIVMWAMLLAVGIALLFARQIAHPIQQLTSGVRQFGQKYSTMLPNHPNRAAHSRYEVDELTHAFQDMSSALEKQMYQLSQLNLAGHHIAARLEETEVFKAISTAVHRLFPVNYLVISFQERKLYQDGDPVWNVYRHDELLHNLLHQALSQGNWTTMALTEENQLSGYLCCATLCVEGRLGLIELYGRNAFIGSQAAGELLGTLSVQISISLENAELVKRLAQRSAELQALLEQLLTAQEEERRRIAYDIHDGLIQMLVGSRLQFANFVAESSQNTEQSTQTLQKGIDGLVTAIVEARRVIEGLRPAALDDLGLAAAVRHLAEIACTETGSSLSMTVDLPYGRLPAPIESTAFRILQEAITNAQKYAEMTRLTVRLKQENGTLHLTVIDDGRGFDPDNLHASRQGGFGLRSMQERARLVGGDCVVEQPAAGGTAVCVTLPIDRNL